MKIRGKEWRPLWIAEINWLRWGIGVELSFGFWWPREFSLYLQFGPLLIGGGMEHDIWPEYDGVYIPVEIPK